MHATSPDAMLELSQIDVSPLDALMTLKAELDTLEARLQAMDERRASVAEQVYLRVRSDYESRRATLEQQAAPLKAAAREQFAKLFALLSRSEADHEAARLDREEIEFRHSLGEFDQGEYERRIAAIDAQLAERAAAREQALAMRQRFVAAFRSEEELKTPEVPADAITSPVGMPILSADAVAAAAKPAPSQAETRKLSTLDPAQLAESAPTRAMPLPSAADIGATQTMKVLKGDAAVPPRPDQTVMIRSARLVPQNNEAGKLTHTVGLRPLTLGSAEQCDIRLPGAAPQHAQLKAGMSGFTVTDMGGGVRVNGIVIDQHLLRHDDVLEVGAARFVFRES